MPLDSVKKILDKTLNKPKNRIYQSRLKKATYKIFSKHNKMKRSVKIKKN